LAGFDGRLSGEISNRTFNTFSKNVAEKWIPEYSKNIDWKRYQAIMQLVLSRKLDGSNNQEQAWFNQQTYALIDELRTTKSDTFGYQSPQYLAHLLDGMVIVANNIWGSRRFDEHDIAMANNLDWLLNTELKNRKVVVWGQFVHVNKRGYTPSNTDNVTSIIKKRYPKQTHVIHFAGFEGSFKNFVTGKTNKIPLSNGNTAEKVLFERFKTTNKLPVFIKADKIDEELSKYPNQKLQFHELNYESTIPAHHWPLYWDSLVLIPYISPSN
jgi:erythromycin esterase